MTVAESFEEYRQRLEITQTEQDDASRRQIGIRKCIQSAFDVSRDFLAGSYARHTKTKPLQDVDVFVVLGTDEEHRHNEAPADIIEAFRSCLASKYGTDSVLSDRRCVTVVFDKPNPSEQDDGKVLSIDVVPAFEAGRHYAIPDKTLATWIDTDPEAHAELATAKNKRLDGKWIPLVKMIRAWNRNSGSPIVPSFLIEVMALDLVDSPCNGYPDEARRFFAAAAEHISDTWPDPAGLGPDVSDEMTSSCSLNARNLLLESERLAARAFREEQLGRTGDALTTWKQIFGRYFPTP